MQAGFKFDINKCVGCHACAIACSIENSLGYENSWRQVNSYNEERQSNLPHYHLSLACNHCDLPICLEQCPAKAIFKNVENGIVFIDESKCMGCKFCSWVCPYDAPKYDQSIKIMSKCTLCNHRLEEGQMPACVSICPTDALEFEHMDIIENREVIFGFPKSKMKPAINLIPLNSNKLLPEQVEIPYSDEIVENYKKNKSLIKSKIEIKNEWTLIIFTLLIAILGGIFSAAVLNNYTVDPLLFAFVATAGIGMSVVHLGKKHRSLRSVLNWQASWLSREIVFIVLFLSCACIYLLFKNNLFIGYMGLIFSLAAAFSTDRVYSATVQINGSKLHSAQILFTFLLFASMFNQFILGFLLIAIIKIVFYLKQNIEQKRRYFYRKVMSTVRILGVLVSGIFLLIGSNEWTAPIVVILILSELIDRIEFYLDLNIMTPAKHMESGFK